MIGQRAAAHGRAVVDGTAIGAAAAATYTSAAVAAAVAAAGPDAGSPPPLLFARELLRECHVVPAFRAVVKGHGDLSIYSCLVLHLNPNAEALVPFQKSSFLDDLDVFHEPFAEFPIVVLVGLIVFIVGS